MINTGKEGVAKLSDLGKLRETIEERIEHKLDKVDNNITEIKMKIATIEAILNCNKEFNSVTDQNKTGQFNSLNVEVATLKNDMISQKIELNKALIKFGAIYGVSFIIISALIYKLVNTYL
ncbi:MAG: hypothetical protein WC144_05015 [Sulfurimonas sp.]|jgi:hypothetical protein